MPDWTYQTVFRPTLLGIGARRGYRLALGGMGFLSRMPLGKRVIQWMGHARPDSRLAVEHNGFEVASPVGLGCALDPHLLATSAFGEFGFGFIEIGPISCSPRDTIGAIEVDQARESLRFEHRGSMTPEAACERLARNGPFDMPIIARIEPTSAEEARRLFDSLRPCVDGIVVPADQLDTVRGIVAADVATSVPLICLVAVDAHAWRDETHRANCSGAIGDGSFFGVVVVAPKDKSSGMKTGRSELVEAVETVRQARAELGRRPLVIGSVGVHCPADALDYIDAGADLIQVDSGLVFGGPGLPKRVNEALLYRRQMTEATMDRPPTRIGEQSWFWAMLMGLGMLLGGVLAMCVATTRVVLPYDEAMSGLTRDQLAEVNDRLLAFMMHDRVTLAGTMLAVGILYVTLAWRGIRHGVHWAYVSVIGSALAGFVSFFSFLGFGYFDPFHAFVSAVLFQFLLLTMHSRLPERHLAEAPDLWNDARWRANQWGQLIFVVHGAVLIVAGLVITYIGMTSVFVHEDLQFMGATAEDLFAAHPRLVPLVAHDRATFGGMLVACGVATLLPALWGFRRGQAWLWWALMLAGNIAYAATLLVHWGVGYDSPLHMLPVFAGLGWLWVGGAASYGAMVATDPKLDAEWEQRLVQAKARP